MEDSHIVETLLEEIANARAGITANYSQLWQAQNDQPRHRTRTRTATPGLPQTPPDSPPEGP